MNIAFIQRVLPKYRVELFKLINVECNQNIKIFIGKDIPNTKVRSTKNFDELNVNILPTIHFSFGSRIFTLHKGLIKNLIRFKPDVIVCEGESNILNNLQILLFYKLFSPSTKLIHWSLGGMPSTHPIKGYKRLIKKFLLSFYDSFIVYSNFGKVSLINLGINSSLVHVAINLSVNNYFNNERNIINNDKIILRSLLGLNDYFTVMYAGDLGDDKRIDLLIQTAIKLKNKRINFIIIGDGDNFLKIDKIIKIKQLHNVYLKARVDWDKLSNYYYSSDIFVLPGLGGIVISEALSFGLAVIVHQADGTELDLVKHGKNGFILKNAESDEIIEYIEYLFNDPDRLKVFSSNARYTVKNLITIQNTIKEIINAIYLTFCRK
jgi:glycosyltransferase involved in cell wall biosynthesis